MKRTRGSARQTDSGVGESETERREEQNGSGEGQSSHLKFNLGSPL